MGLVVESDPALPQRPLLVRVWDGLTSELLVGERAGRRERAAQQPAMVMGPLWSLHNCLITPHTANTWEMAEPLFAERVGANVGRRLRGEPLLGLVDPALGY